MQVNTRHDMIRYILIADIIFYIQKYFKERYILIADIIFYIQKYFKERYILTTFQIFLQQSK